MPPSTEVGIDAPHAERQLRRAPKEVERSLRRQAASLASDPLTGTFISLQRVPKASKDRWEARIGLITNLFKLDLPAGWRAIYTVVTHEERRAALVIDVVDHKEYERLLGYR